MHYCLECARWFVDETTLAKHRGSKVHKRRSNTCSFGADGRLKQLDEAVYTQKDAEAAIGLSTDGGEVKGAMMDLR